MTNQLISNLKKKPTRKGWPEYKYKGAAIRKVAEAFATALNAEWLNRGTLVPIPPSKAKNDPDYDDRMVQVCKNIPGDIIVDVRELVIQSESTRANHEVGDGNRLTISELIDVYEINEDISEPTPSAIAIVDDVLTNGSHFRAMKQVLTDRYEFIPIVGVFVARRIFPELVPEDFGFYPAV